MQIPENVQIKNLITYQITIPTTPNFNPNNQFLKFKIFSIISLSMLI